MKINTTISQSAPIIPCVVLLCSYIIHFSFIRPPSSCCHVVDVKIGCADSDAWCFGVLTLRWGLGEQEVVWWSHLGRSASKCPRSLSPTTKTLLNKTLQYGECLNLLIEFTCVCVYCMLVCMCVYICVWVPLCIYTCMCVYLSFPGVYVVSQFQAGQDLHCTQTDMDSVS